MAANLTDTELLARLVGFDTTSHLSNRPLADFVCDYLDRPGVEVLPHDAPEGDKRNLVIHLGPAVDPEERAGLVLSGHMDVVPAEEPDWHSDPFELTDAGDRLVGRGACDMKGFVALAVNRARRLDPRDLTRPLVLLLTYDEETGTEGARHFAGTWPLDERPLPRAAIIGEPTNLEVVRMHKGHLKVHVIFSGTGAHSGYPHLGVNAIEPAGAVIQALTRLRRELEAERPAFSEHFPEVPYVALNVARIRGGVAVNVVPERCVLDLGSRVLPGMQSDQLVERIRRTVDEAMAQFTAGLAEPPRWRIEVGGDSPPLLLGEEAPICRYLYGLTGQQETVSVSYATDGGWFQSLGLDCAIFGPGSIEVAHKPNEYVPKEALRRAGDYLDQTILDFCVG